MWILNKSSIYDLIGNIETDTDFTISNLYDDDLGVFAKGTTSIKDGDTDATADDVLIKFWVKNASVISLLNINSYENSISVYERNEDGTNGDIVIDNIVLETTSQKKATLEFDAVENVNVEVVLKTNEACVIIGEIVIGHFSKYGYVKLPLSETPIDNDENFVELDNGSKYYFYSETEQDIRYSYSFTLFFEERADKLGLQSFLNRTKKRNLLIKISDFPEHIKFGQINSYDFSYEDYNEAQITFNEVI